MDRLDQQRCLELLERGGYGRVAERALPAIVPVNYLMDDGIVVVGGSNAHLHQILDGNVAAFDADGTDAASDTAWHVCVTGYAHSATEAEERERWPAALAQRRCSKGRHRVSAARTGIIGTKIHFIS
ncbi:Pyridoxamine 5'-phosphate oxidase [Streptomyces sp. 1222.5]|uniref:pyridoxamine 5'-phosphate oxidase family protein n=1 Tax=unclassified Streptomyces TaxID=2593676 RepID=UPI00089B1A0A|nr:MULTISPECIES: pyridoxamine 5'-phosphate oxidase family protein [unclassified Streptomyces]PKW05982.1 pyridoxamine 5'-phosphate oxidase-like protein [Streptomyces sp. 5112.2]SED23942.1 Pyridoxamine 5'-phosphate oxidase [Streptomyces sp. 1222.5]